MVFIKAEEGFSAFFVCCYGKISSLAEDSGKNDTLYLNLYKFVLIIYELG